MKNQEIEKIVFEIIDESMGWKANEVQLGDHPDVTCKIKEQRVAIELTEVLDSSGDPKEIVASKKGLEQETRMFDQDYFVKKICGSLKRKVFKDYSVPGHEIWLICYANHISLEGIEVFLSKSEIRSVIWQSFLKYQKNIERVIVFDLNTKKLIVEAIKKTIQSSTGFND